MLLLFALPAPVLFLSFDPLPAAPPAPRPLAVSPSVGYSSSSSPNPSFSVACSGAGACPPATEGALWVELFFLVNFEELFRDDSAPLLPALADLLEVECGSVGLGYTLLLSSRPSSIIRSSPRGTPPCLLSAVMPASSSPGQDTTTSTTASSAAPSSRAARLLMLKPSNVSPPYFLPSSTSPPCIDRSSAPRAPRARTPSATISLAA